MASKLPTRSTLPAAPTRWIGGVIRPRRCTHRGKPMRLAAWIDSAGSILAAAIVEGHGPTVLREMLDELLVEVDEPRRPQTLTVSPDVRAAFAGLEYPAVTVERDEFLILVIEDEVDFGRIPGGLPARVGERRSA